MKRSHKLLLALLGLLAAWVAGSLQVRQKIDDGLAEATGLNNLNLPREDSAGTIIVDSSEEDGDD